MRDSGVVFECSCDVGTDITTAELKQQFDAVALCVGANQRRDLAIEGNSLSGVVQAMDFLSHNNQVVAQHNLLSEGLSAKGKHVVVIGGGDTGSDCIGTAVRQGAEAVLNFEIMPKPSISRPSTQPWPHWPMRLRTTTSHKEGVKQNWSIVTKAFVGNEQGELIAVKTVKVEWTDPMTLVEIPGTEKQWPCDMVLLAMGFTGSLPHLADKLKLQLNDQHLYDAKESDYQVNDEGLFAAGDCRRGQSLIVWAISEGREMAHQLDKFLMGTSQLPQKGPGDLPSP